MTRFSVSRVAQVSCGITPYHSASLAFHHEKTEGGILGLNIVTTLDITQINTASFKHVLALAYQTHDDTLINIPKTPNDLLY